MVTQDKNQKRGEGNEGPGVSRHNKRVDMLHDEGGTKGLQKCGFYDSLVSQPWSDLGRRAIPLIGNINFVDNFGAKVDASACEAFV